MERGWTDYRAIHGSIEGARAAFEKDCELLFRKEYDNTNVQIVKASGGDGGIDIFIGDMDSPIQVVQCKCFLDDFGSSQIQQIDSSFKTAYKAENYEMKKWTLAVPRELTFKEHKKWADWLAKVKKEFDIDDSFPIKLMNGNELIQLMKENGVYSQIFDIKELLTQKEQLAVAKETLSEAKKSNAVLSTIAYDKIHNEEEEQNILLKIFDSAIQNSKGISDEEKQRIFEKLDSDGWVHTQKVKIPLNFKKIEYQQQVEEYFRLSLLKQQVIREIYNSYDIEEQKDIQLSIKFSYDKKKNSLSKIDVLNQLIDEYTLKKDNPQYISLAVAFVLTFFEDCTVFDKTDKEKEDNQTTLF